MFLYHFLSIFLIFDHFLSFFVTFFLCFHFFFVSFGSIQPPPLAWTDKFWFKWQYYWCDWHTIVTLKSKNEPIWTNFIVGFWGFSIFGLFLGWILTLSWSQGSGWVNFCSNMTCYTILEMAEPQQDICVNFETISQR